MSGWSEADARALVAAFEDLTLSRADWTHEAHLVVAADLVMRHGAGAVDAVRAGITRLNDFHGVEQTATSGYHESLTVLYVTLIQDHLARLPDGAGWCERVNSVVKNLADRALPHRFYSPERLGSGQARLQFVEPDLHSLP